MVSWWSAAPSSLAPTGESIQLEHEARVLAICDLGEIRDDDRCMSPVGPFLIAKKNATRNMDRSPEDIRCAHELDESFVKKLIDRRVRVKGSPEYASNGVVRLLWVEEVELLT